MSSFLAFWDWFSFQFERLMFAAWGLVLMLLTVQAVWVNFMSLSYWPITVGLFLFVLIMLLPYTIWSNKIEDRRYTY